MTSLTKHKQIRSDVLCLSILCLFAVSFSSLEAQLTNGVFDPTKCLVAKEQAMELEVIKATITSANEFNKTLGTPSHPRPHIPVPPNPNGAPPRYGPEQVQVPTFDAPPKKKRRGFRRREVSTPFVKPSDLPGSQGKPEVEVNRAPVNFSNPELPSASGVPLPPLEKPSATANPVSLGPTSAEAPLPEGRSDSPGFFARKRNSRSQDDVPGIEAPASSYPPSGSSVDALALGNSPGTGSEQVDRDLSSPSNRRNGLFNRFIKPKPISVDNIDMNTAETPVFNTYMADLPEVQEGAGETVPLDAAGILELPANSSSPDGGLPQSEGTRKGLARFFAGKGNKSKVRNRTLDIPNRPIPISINAGQNSGNPYTSDSFQATNYSPLIDGPRDPSGIRDLTSAGALPFSGGSLDLQQLKPSSDISQYYVIKRDGLVFHPYKHGSDTIDYENSYELFADTAVRDFGLVGGKRKIQIDSGERGLVAKDGVRSLSVSEAAVMKNGLAAGQRWYSILDTEAEEGFASAPANSMPVIGGGSARPAEPKPKPNPKPKVSVAKPEDDVSQYYVVKIDGATFEPFVNGTRETDPDAAYQMFDGTVVKVLANTGENKVISTFTGENGLISNAVVRPLDDTEKTRMKEGINNGKAWYSILDTEAALQ